MTIIDTHQHVWDLSAHDQPWLHLPGNEPLLRDYSEADLRPLAAAAGVTATVVVQTVAEPAETPGLLELAAASDLISGVVGWVDLESDQVTDAIAALQYRPDGDFLRGIRHPVLIEPDVDWLRRPAVHRGLAAVGVAGLCYDIVVPPLMLPAAVAAVEACQDTTFVLDHLGNPADPANPDQAWTSAIRQLAEFPNTFCKLSGVLAEPGDIRPVYDIALNAFGPDRLMFGSDWPPCTLTATYDSVVAKARELVADLSPAGQDAVLAGTASRVYRLP
ncbi:MAG TPA: amidohydrolase family protein [Streptosporangiaceae bacterium]|nr:amidohydrolase family protein [Streptosporangiaceae bacterium]